MAPYEHFLKNWLLYQQAYDVRSDLKSSCRCSFFVPSRCLLLLTFSWTSYGPDSNLPAIDLPAIVWTRALLYLAFLSSMLLATFENVWCWSRLLLQDLCVCYRCKMFCIKHAFILRNAQKPITDSSHSNWVAVLNRLWPIKGTLGPIFRICNELLFFQSSHVAWRRSFWGVILPLGKHWLYEVQG